MIIEQMQTGIRVACAKRNKNLSEAASDAGISPSTITRFMNNTTDIRLVTLAEFCRKGLGYSFETVLRMGK